MRHKCSDSVGAKALYAGLAAALISGPALSDVWVFSPSVSFDQRFDDNFFLSTLGEGTLSASRALGELGVSREARDYVFEGLARVDALVTTQAEVGPEELDSNQFLGLSYTQVTPRSRYGISVNYTQDTPSRDITADISEESSTATDTGLVVTQLVAGEITQSLLNNVARSEFIVEPTYEYDITRRLTFDASAAYTSVQHGTATTQDIIYQRYLDVFADSSEPLLGYNEVTIEDVGTVFRVSGELDDFDEIEFELGLDYSLSSISSTSVSLGYSRLTTNTEFPDTFVQFEEQIPDSNERRILRNPRYDSVSSTSRIILGYERIMSPVFRWSIGIGAYQDVSDDLLDEDDREDLSTVVPTSTIEEDGFLANASITYDAGRTQYRLGFAADVQPSSVGSQIETNRLTGELDRKLSPRLDFSLTGVAFEPDRVGALVDDQFARRFISFEPRIDWKVTRNWTATAAYRYRRQRARVETESAESNALLFAIKYSAPSKVRDAAREVGL